MAFQQPQQRPQASRQLSLPLAHAETQLPASPARKRTIEESQEWILFSPAQHQDTSSRTSQTPRTATYRSDSVSLETHVRSQAVRDSVDENEADAEADDNDGELDSLDDGLRAFDHDPFHTSPYNRPDQSGGTMLPTHDGLGTFTSSAGLQEQLWQFERHNPHRRKHLRRTLDEVDEEMNLDPDQERTARIEQWRLEQSRAVLEEIEKETKRRRRKMSMASGVSGSIDARTNMHDSMGSLGHVTTILEQSEISKDAAPEPTESWWHRITRRVIQDLIGLDENTLSVIFGEQLPEDSSPTLTQKSPIAAAAAAESQVTFRDQDHAWELKLMERIAKELGVLVNEVASHEGAFSTYTHAQDTSLPTRVPEARFQHRRRLSSHRTQNIAPAATADSLFRPTLPVSSGSQPDTSLWGIEEEPADLGASAQEAETRKTQEREYYARSLDLATLFSYLARRFSPSPPAAAAGPLPASWTTPSSSRAEHIRLHHPLTSSRAAEIRRRDSVVKRRELQSSLLRRQQGSSCASQSGKRSCRSVSSRHYWDFGLGTQGSEGVFSSQGEGGGWGEV